MPPIVVIYAKSDPAPIIRAICEEYWRLGEGPGASWALTLGQVADKFDLSQHVVSQIARDNSHGSDHSLTCTTCWSPHRCTGRTDYVVRRARPSHTCETCVLSARAAEEERARTIEAAKRQLLLEVLGSPGAANVKVAEIPLAAAMYLLAVARASSSEAVELLGPLRMAPTAATPSITMTAEALTRLRDAGLIAPDPSSPVEAFDWKSGNPIANLDLSQVVWRIARDELGQPLVPLLARHLSDRTWNPSWRSDVFDLWRAIVLQEAIEFLLLSLEDHRLHISPGEKTAAVLTTALDNYSLTRVWGVIWRAAKDGAAFRARGAEPWHAAASVISRIEGYTQHALTQGWDLKPYRRHWRTSRSTLSRVFFDDLLQLPSYEDERTPPPMALTGSLASSGQSPR